MFMKFLYLLSVLCGAISIQANTMNPVKGSLKAPVFKAQRMGGPVEQSWQAQTMPAFELLEPNVFVVRSMITLSAEEMDRRTQQNKDDMELRCDLGFTEDELKAIAKLRAQQETESKGKSQAQVAQKNKDAKLDQ
jgi:hypothetical protein